MMDMLSKMPVTRKIAATEYGAVANHSLARLVHGAGEYGGLPDAGDARPDLLLDMAQHADYALSDLQTRLQEYNIHAAGIRELQELFIDSYRELYTEKYLSAVEKKVKEFDALLEKEKLKAPKSDKVTWSEKLKDPRYYRSLWDEGKKTLRLSLDNIRLLASFIPFLNIKSEYRTRLYLIFGTEAMRKLHEETHGAVIPLVEKKIEKHISDQAEVYGAVFRNFKIPGASFLSEEFSTSFKISSASAVMGLTSTVVLAAGWHTFAWSIMNLFIPMLFAIILPAAILSALGLQNYDIRKKQEGLEKARRQVNEYIVRQVMPILVESSREKLKALAREKEGEIFSSRFPGATGLGPRDMNIAVMELSAFIREVSGSAGGEIDESVMKTMAGRIGSMAAPGNISAEALYAAAYLESLLEYINVKAGLGVNTLRDGGIAAVVSKMKDRGMLGDEQYALVTRARRARNRLAHRFHEFETMEERFRTDMAGTIKEACLLLGECAKKLS